MKKIFLSLIAAVACMSINAQVVKVYENDELTATYTNSSTNTVKVVFEEASAAPSDQNLLTGKFTVAEGKQVQFTKGNLYYSTTDSKYHLEDTQNATYGTDDGTYAATHVYHFFWSNTTDWQTSGKEPWASNYTCSAQSTSDKFFCGVDNPMTVDGTAGLYALTSAEWSYLLGTNTTRKGKYAKGVSVTIGDKTVTNCLVIAPDNYSGTIAKSYDASAWETAEAAGLVCLPAAGCREDSYLSVGGSCGNYWSATPHSSVAFRAHGVYFYDSDVNALDIDVRSLGRSLRLVK